MQIAQLLSVLALCVAVILLAISNRRAHDRITTMLADNFDLVRRLMHIEQKLAEVDKGLDKATKLVVAANAHAAKAVNRCDGITARINTLIETNNLKPTKKSWNKTTPSSTNCNKPM